MQLTDGQKRLVAFIIERERIRIAKEAGKPKPWTRDPILQTYSFCNIHREDDRVTRWLADGWRKEHGNDIDFWFACAVMRMAVNWPDTLDELGYPVPWDRRRFVKVLQARAARDEKVYGGAYMIGTQGNAGNKAEFLAEKLLSPLWLARARVRPRLGDTLHAFHARLSSFYAAGSFTAAQVVADAKYTGPLREAKDWHVWAASGPGSRRGLNRVLDRPLKAGWAGGSELGPGMAWLVALRDLHRDTAPALAKVGIELHAQDLQNCLCEFDKYERTRLGEGRPRALYDGKGE